MKLKRYRNLHDCNWTASSCSLKRETRFPAPLGSYKEEEVQREEGSSSTVIRRYLRCTRHELNELTTGRADRMTRVEYAHNGKTLLPLLRHKSLSLRIISDWLTCTHTSHLVPFPSLFALYLRCGYST